MATFTVNYKDGCGNTLATETYDSSSTTKVMDEITRLGLDQITRKGYKIDGWTGSVSLSDTHGIIISSTTTIADVWSTSEHFNNDYGIIQPIWEYNFWNDAYCANQSNENYTMRDLNSLKINKILIGFSYGTSYLEPIDVSGFSMLYIEGRTAYPRNFETGIWVSPSELKMASGGATEYQIYGIDGTGAIKSIKYKGESLTSVSFSANTFAGMKIYGIL